jgi:hypothetical protein
MMKIATEVLDRKRGQDGRKFTTAAERAGEADNAASRERPVRFTEVTLPPLSTRPVASTAEAVRLEAILPDCTIVRGAGPAELAAILRVLRS